MGGRAGGGASGGMGSRSMSDAAIARLAADKTPYTTKDLNPINEPLLKSGEYIEKHGSFDGGKIWDAHSSKIENDVGIVADKAPQHPSSNSNAQKKKYYYAYQSWSKQMDAAYDKAISAYKTDLGRTKNKALKVQIAKNIARYKQYKIDAVEVNAWVNKHYSKYA